MAYGVIKCIIVDWGRDTVFYGCIITVLRCCYGPAACGFVQALIRSNGVYWGTEVKFFEGILKFIFLKIGPCKDKYKVVFEKNGWAYKT